MKVTRAAITTIALSLSAVAVMAQTGNIVATGIFHGAAHKTADRATVYQSSSEEVLLLPRAERHLIDGGHFLLEEHSEFVADKIIVFLAKGQKAEAGK